MHGTFRFRGTGAWYRSHACAVLIYVQVADMEVPLDGRFCMCHSADQCSHLGLSIWGPTLEITIASIISLYAGARHYIDGVSSFALCPQIFHSQRTQSISLTCSLRHRFPLLWPLNIDSAQLRADELVICLTVLRSESMALLPITSPSNSLHHRASILTARCMADYLRSKSRPETTNRVWMFGVDYRYIFVGRT